MLPEMYAVVKDQVAPCGLKCGECGLGNGTVAENALNLKRDLEQYGVSQWAPLVPGGKDVDFVLLGKNLTWIGEMIGCPGCLRGGGNPECPIRLCSKERGMTSCGQCTDLKECRKFDWLGDHGKNLKDQMAPKQ